MCSHDLSDNDTERKHRAGSAFLHGVMIVRMTELYCRPWNDTLLHNLMKKSILFLRCGRFGPLCGCLYHLRRCIGVAAPVHCRCFVFYRDYIIYGGICQRGDLHKSEQLVLCKIYVPISVSLIAPLGELRYNINKEVDKHGNIRCAASSKQKVYKRKVG